MPTCRVDAELVNRGLAASIEQARLMILEGKVYQGAGKVVKGSDRVNRNLPLTVRDRSLPFVSRGGYKLQEALKVFGLSVQDRICLDVGASTGGFTDVMRQHGAAKIYAVDVGFGLLDWSLRGDPRVEVMERTNARFLTPEMFAPRPSFGATDVSFISLKAILPPALAVLEGSGRRFVALIKPQFEARREDVGPGGVVRDIGVHRAVCLDLCRYAGKLGWKASGFAPSPITGAGGNVEFLMALSPEDCACSGVTEGDIEREVEYAYEKFMKI
ncbi:MAG: TlyA family RNA methyltransferase [Clostridia bacterium]|nr:TlyA family RNA methyltransferase [Clostridia bacterium]